MREACRPLGACSPSPPTPAPFPAHPKLPSGLPSPPKPRPSTGLTLALLSGPARAPAGLQPPALALRGDASPTGWPHGSPRAPSTPNRPAARLRPPAGPSQPQGGGRGGARQPRRPGRRRPPLVSAAASPPAAAAPPGALRVPRHRSRQGECGSLSMLVVGWHSAAAASDATYLLPSGLGRCRPPSRRRSARTRRCTPS